MKVADLITWFESWVSPTWQEDWDNCGWQIEPGILELEARVLVCLTPTLAVMNEAIAIQKSGVKINLIFAHHPLILHPIKSLCSGNLITEISRLAFAHKISIYTAHTNFDKVRDGTSDVLGQILSLQGSVPIVPTQEDLGYGRVGDLPHSMTFQELLIKIHSKLHAPKLLFSPTTDLQQKIFRVAVLGGSGASFISAVVKTSAQLYLTSDCKFHQFQESRDAGLILVDAGHYATERPACNRLVQKLKSLPVDWVQLSQKDEDFRHFYP